MLAICDGWYKLLTEAGTVPAVGGDFAYICMPFMCKNWRGIYFCVGEFMPTSLHDIHLHALARNYCVRGIYICKRNLYLHE